MRAGLATGGGLPGLGEELVHGAPVVDADDLQLACGLEEDFGWFWDAGVASWVARRAPRTGLGDIRRRFAVGIAVAAVILCSAPPALASASLSLLPQSGPAGQVVQVTGAGFQPGEQVVVGWDPGQQDQQVLGDAQAHADGTLAPVGSGSGARCAHVNPVCWSSDAAGRSSPRLTTFSTAGST